MQRLTISLDDAMAEAIDDWMAKRGYSNRSEAMRDLVTAFYGDLPGNTSGAWETLDTHYQQRAGRTDFLSFWSTIESVSLLSVTPRDATSVVARLRYVLRDGGVDTEDRWLSVVPADGRLLIFDSERIGPA